MKFEVMLLENLPAQTGRVVQVMGKEIALFRLGNGKVRAIENRCPHKGGPLAEGIVSGEFVFCPLHDWKISLNEGQVQFPDTGCVKTYQTEIEENRIYILANAQDFAENDKLTQKERGMLIPK